MKKAAGEMGNYHIPPPGSSPRTAPASASLFCQNEYNLFAFYFLISIKYYNHGIDVIEAVGKSFKEGPKASINLSARRRISPAEGRVILSLDEKL